MRRAGEVFTVLLIVSGMKACEFQNYLGFGLGEGTRVASWGWETLMTGSRGQIAIIAILMYSLRFVPTMVNALSGYEVIEVATGKAHALFLTSCGKVDPLLEFQLLKLDH